MEELLATYGSLITTLTLEPRSGGMFEVNYNGLIIFSKKWLGRFPEKGEIVKLIEEVKSEPFFRTKVLAWRVARRSPRLIKKLGKEALYRLLIKRTPPHQ
jgi:selenoprotein W-related protein